MHVDGARPHLQGLGRGVPHEGEVAQHPCHAGGPPGGSHVYQMPLPLLNGPVFHPLSLLVTCAIRYKMLVGWTFDFPLLAVPFWLVQHKQVDKVQQILV